jgi:tetratricopeptide (TPR) repeat protein
MTAESDTPATPQPILGQLRDLGFKYIQDEDYASAQFAFKKILELDNKDLNARFVYAHLIDDGTHKKRAESRDMLLSILDEYPGIFDNPTEHNLKLIRGAAVKCSHVGPFTKATELFRKLARMSNSAGDFYLLSEILTQGNFFEEAISNLEKAIALDPATYDTKANRETLEISRSRLSQAANGKKKIGRYPETTEFLAIFRS